jgi:predicted transcriptional regulator
LKRNKILSASLIVIVFAFSFFAVTYLQVNIVGSSNVSDVDNAQPLIFSAPIILGVDFNEDSRLLNQSTRIEIYNFVKNNPGIHFRGICDNLGLPIGVVQYHLGLLTRAGLLLVHRDRQYKRYFETQRFGEIEMKMISLLRHKTVRRILAVLSERDSIFHKDLAVKLDISSQALTWQMNRLRKTGLVDAVKEGMKVKYLLNQENAMTVKSCLCMT